MLWDCTTDRNVGLLNQITITTFQRALNPEKTQSWSPPYILVSIIVYWTFCRSRVSLRHHKAGNHRNVVQWTSLSWINMDINKKHLRPSENQVCVFLASNMDQSRYSAKWNISTSVTFCVQGSLVWNLQLMQELMPKRRGREKHGVKVFDSMKMSSHSHDLLHNHKQHLQRF